MVDGVSEKREDEEMQGRLEEMLLESLKREEKEIGLRWWSGVPSEGCIDFPFYLLTYHLSLFSEWLLSLSPPCTCPSCSPPLSPSLPQSTIATTIQEGPIWPIIITGSVMCGVPYSSLDGGHPSLVLKRMILNCRPSVILVDQTHPQILKKIQNVVKEIESERFFLSSSVKESKSEKKDRGERRKEEEKRCCYVPRVIEVRWILGQCSPQSPKRQKREPFSSPTPNSLLFDDEKGTLTWTLSTLEEENISSILESSRLFLNERTEISFDPEQLLHVFFTSGSTGSPKGCLIKRKTMATYCKGYGSFLNFKKQEKSCEQPKKKYKNMLGVASSHTFDVSSGDFLTCWTTGTSIALSPRSLIFEDLFSFLSMTSSTHVTTTPSLFETLSTNSPSLPPSLQVVCLGGEPMKRRTIRQYAKSLSLYNLYGVTECCVYQSFCRVKETDSSASLSLGRPFDPQTKLRLVHPVEMREIKKEGEIGEIWICGRQVGGGYSGKDLIDLSKSKFVEKEGFGPCYRTGDVGRLRGDGTIIWQRRMDLQIKINGKRIDLLSVEDSLSDLVVPSLVKELVIVPVKCGGNLMGSAGATNGSDRLIISALVVHWDKDHFFDQSSSSSSPPSLPNPTDVTFHQSTSSELNNKIIQQLGQLNLPEYMQPKSLFSLQSIPRNSSGKVDRKKIVSFLSDPSNLKNAFQMKSEGEEERNGEEEENLSEMEGLVGNIWLEELGLSSLIPLSPQMNFFHLGGESLAALRVCRRLHLLFSQTELLSPALSSSSQSSKSTISLTSSESGAVFLGEVLKVRPQHILQHPTLSEFTNFCLFNEIVTLPSSSSSSSSSQLSSSLPSRHFVSSTDSSSSPSEIGVLSKDEWMVQAIMADSIAAVNYILSANSPFCSSSQETTTQTETPYLHLAAKNGSLNVIQYLLEKQPHFGSVVSKNSQNQTVLHVACLSFSIDLVRYLLQQQQQNGSMIALLQRDEYGQSVLHSACRSGAPPSLVQVLIDALLLSQNSSSSSNPKSKKNQFSSSSSSSSHAIFSQTDKWKRTPMHWAVDNGHGNIVQLLMKYDTSSLQIEDYQKERPLLIAERRARCSAKERPDGERASTWGAIAKFLGGSGTTNHLRKNQS